MNMKNTCHKLEASFEVFEDAPNQWFWRLIHRTDVYGPFHTEEEAFKHLQKSIN